MINGRTTIENAGCKYNIDVIFHIHLRRFEIVIPLISEKILDLSDSLLGNKFSEIVIVNTMGQEYTAYDCVCMRIIKKIDAFTVLGQYKTLIKGRNIPKDGMISFHFQGLEYFLSKCSLVQYSELPKKENDWSLLKIDEKIDVVAQISCNKNIYDLLSVVIKVREYFEFLINKQVYVDRIVYSNGRGEEIEILNDNLLTFFGDYELINQVSKEKPEAIIKGLNQWVNKYGLYKEVIKIWRKTIYNRHVSDEDIFIWKCQSLELLCTSYEPIRNEAGKLKASKQQYPNLSNFLQALNSLHKFVNCDIKYFDEVRKVRNVYTHYNPDKHFTEREWYNASHLIDVALRVAIIYVFDLDIKNIVFPMLVPKGIKEEIKY